MRAELQLETVEPTKKRPPHPDQKVLGRIRDRTARELYRLRIESGMYDLEDFIDRRPS